MRVSSVVIEFSDKQSGFIPDMNNDDKNYKIHFIEKNDSVCSLLNVQLY